ncbi:XdhC family protein [Sinimarinibacterium flocculans]|uniref:XdhC family protein n=1 Tax=Sinimarinibacterium flocculans TaxID=985250 RepID=UPI003517A9CD
MNTPEEFAALHTGAHRLAATGGGAVATLLRTRGPVFRRAGTRMLIGRDGSIVRGLSAGCPEADLVARARALFDHGGSNVVRYDRENGYDALLELGCGGEMEILVETFSTADDLRYLDAVDALMRQRRSGWLATWFASDGRGLPRPRRLLWAEGTLFDEIADDRIATAIAEWCADARDGATRAQSLDSGTRRVEVLYERVLPPLALYVVGDNAGAHALAELGRRLGWQVTIVTHVAASANPQPRNDIVWLQAPPDRLAGMVRLDARSAVVVMTHNLERDLDYLRGLRSATPGYLGALGSRIRAGRMRAALGDDAPPLHAPAGLDIGSETPEEIALAIAAEIQAVLRGHAGGALSRGDGPIH